MYSATERNPYFTEEDEEIASLVAMEAGFSGYTHYNNQAKNPPSSSSSFYHSISSSRSARFSGARFEHRRLVSFLESCFLCKKRLSDRNDIFMYRDTAFCSQDCREKQIEIDEAKNTNLIKSSSRKKEQRKSTKNVSFEPDTVVTA